jgi:conjugal transfer ATP-binding protein TraC
VPRIDDLLTPLACDDDGLFVLDNQSVAFGFLASPLSGSDPSASDRLNTLLNSDWPPGAVVQCCLWAGPDVGAQVAAYLERRAWLSPRDPRSAAADEAAGPRELLRAYADSVAVFNTGGSEQPLLPDGGLRARDIQLLITCMLPTDAAVPAEGDLKRARSLQGTVARGLRAVGIAAEPLTADRWLRVAETLFNWSDLPGWRQGSAHAPEPDAVLKRQVVDYDMDLRVEANGLWLRDTVVKMLSAKRLPARAWWGMAAAYLGDVATGGRGIRENALITATLHFPESQKARGNIERKRTWTVNQAHGPLIKYIPELALRKAAFEELHEALLEGDRPVQLYLGIALFAPSLEAAEAAAANARAYWAELGFQLMEDRHLHLPCFLNCLPFGADRAAIRHLFRYKTVATRHALPLLPLFGDWKGTGTPDFTLISRNGQLMNMALFDSDASFNAVIAAQSGSGKSFLTNEIISAYLSIGAQVWVVDVGGSYAKQVEMYQGDLLDFEPGREMCINPFPLVADYGDEEDILAGLIVAMAAPTQPLSDLQIAELKRAMKGIWDRKGGGMTVDDLAAVLVAHEDLRIRDVGNQLYPFTSQGEYGRYLSGRNTVSFRNAFTVLELEALKGRRHLQQVVLLELVYQIQQTVYRGDRSRPKLVIIDEAWDLLASTSVGSFINDAYRRFRKYGASAIVIMQSVADLYENPVGRAIAENSPNMYLLGQKADTIEGLKRDARLPIAEAGYDLLKSVHTIAGVYSEIFCITQRGAGIGRLIVDPFRMLMYSTKHTDVADIQRKSAEGLDVAAAIRALLSERGNA